MELYFSQYFNVDVGVLDDYGAFDISVVSDLPLFIDPFLLFNSVKPEYRQLHDDIIKYLIFLRDKASSSLDQGLIDSWYRFKEVKQNWLGFTLFGNEGHALGKTFADALHGSLGSILSDFGSESVTQGSHLEKVCLIRGGVGRDSISDFTTNLIKKFLLEYTQKFAQDHLDPKQCAKFNVTRAAFNYDTESWETATYYLPELRGDYVLLTPIDMLTRDDTWISYPDMLRRFPQLPAALPDAQLRSQVDNYFRTRLSPNPTAKEVQAAAAATLAAFPLLVDYYIRFQEDNGDGAEAVSAQRVDDTRHVLVERVKRVLEDLDAQTDFNQKPWTSYEEALDRVLAFKHYVEHRDGYRLINRNGQPFSQEAEVQIFFGLIWCYTSFDINREPNNGRGPVDFKVSFGAGDKSLIEFKLASNTSLRRNLEKQVEIYKEANKTRSAVTAIICYTAEHQARVAKILKELKLEDDKGIVLIDARSDNKPSASKA